MRHTSESDDPLIRSLVNRRHSLKLSQKAVATSMETSRYQIMKFERGREVSWEFINRYALCVNASISVAVEYLNA